MLGTYLSSTDLHPWFYKGIIKAVAKEKNIVGADILELSPTPGISAPDLLAAKLAYKIIGHATS